MLRSSISFLLAVATLAIPCAAHAQQPPPAYPAPRAQTPAPAQGWTPGAAQQQAYPGQRYQGQAYPGQAYPGQPYPGQAYPGQAYPGQAYQGQAHPGQAYPGQAYPGQVSNTGQPNRTGQQYPPPGYGAPAGYNSPYAGAPWAPPAAADQPTSSSGTGPIIGGVITLSTFYLASVLTGAGLGEACGASPPEELEGTGVEFSFCGTANADMAYIPVIGPFIALGELEGSELSVWPLDVALVGLGLGQLTGVGLLAAGAILSGQAPSTPDEQSPQLTVRPVVSPTAAAIQLHAAF